jgi:polyisoprenoid-binding protein YceI
MFRKLLPALMIVFALAVASCSAPSAAGPAPTGAAVPTTAPADTATAAAPADSPLASPLNTDTMTPTVSAGTATTATEAAPTTQTMTTTDPTPVTVVTPTASTSTATGGAIHLTLGPDTTANYKVREQLARRNLPSDAIGTTSGVSGTLMILPDGTLPAGQSKITVDLTTLKSDEGQRDRFIQRNTLQTAQYPTAEFVPTSVQGLPSPLPTSGDVTFKLIGNMTIHGVTKPATWDAKATIANNALTGVATTTFTFEDYGMTPPQVMVVLSVADHIELDVNFHLVQAAQ